MSVSRQQKQTTFVVLGVLRVNWVSDVVTLLYGVNDLIQNHGRNVTLRAQIIYNFCQ